MPACTACKKRKDAGEFRKYSRICKGCESEGAQRRRSRRRTKVRELVCAYLHEHPCTDCGETDIVVLEFDHRDPKLKALRISEHICQGYGWETIKAEIDKCDVRCANCHRRRTAKQLGWYAAKTARKRA